MNAFSNMRSPHDLDDLNLGQVAAMPVEELKALHGQVLHDLAKSQIRKKKIVMALAETVEAGLVPGTVGGDGFVIKAPKKVTWKQPHLAALYDEIKRQGKDPEVYIQEVKTYKVQENAYKVWPEAIQDNFKQARQVDVGAISVVFS